MLAYLQTGWNYFINVLRFKHRLGWRSFVFLGVIVLALVLITSPIAQAGDLIDTVVGIIADIILWVATLFLKLAIFCLTFIIEVAGYNKYLDSTAVNYGWVMVRDLTNMIFVVILLLIAFGTILGIEQYEWKKMLVKFVAAAILVNFSRIICGVMIDLGQVVMITFINGVAATAGGNLINAFGANEIMSLAENGAVGAEELNSGEVFMAAVMAVVFSGMMLMTMLVYLVILVARMIQLWILIVLSPFAFVFSVIPTTQKYASEWWQKFGSNVVSGPIVAFFLWLSFVTLGQGNAGAEVAEGSAVKNTVGDGSDPSQSAGITKAMSWAKMANFAIAIGMLLVGAETAQKLGVTGGSMMSKVGDFGKKVATIASGVALGNYISGKAKDGGKALGKGVLMNAPLVGGNSWKARGKFLGNQGIRVGKWWNETAMGGKERKGAMGFISRQFQVGRTKKIMEELERQGKVYGGQLGSAANIESYKARTDVLEGGAAVRKKKSESKRSERMLNSQRDTINDLGPEYGGQILKTDTAQMGLTAAETSAKLAALESDGKTRDSLIKIRLDRDHLEHEYSGRISELVGKADAHHGGEAIEQEQQLDEHGKPLSEAEHNFEKASGDVSALETFKNSNDELQRKLGLDDGNSDKISREQYAADYAKIFSTLPTDLQKQVGETGNLDDLIVQKNNEKELAGANLSTAKSSQIKLDPAVFDSQLKLLEDMKKAFETGKFDEKMFSSAIKSGLAEKTFGVKGNAFDQTFVQKFNQGQQAKKLDETIKLLSGIKKAGTRSMLASAYSKARGDEMSSVSALRKGQVEEKVFERLIARRKGATVPSDVMLKTASSVGERNFGHMNQKQLIDAYKGITDKMAAARQNDKGYKHSSEYDKDNLWLKGLMVQLHKTCFQDDVQGTAEGHLSSLDEGEKAEIKEFIKRMEAGKPSGYGKNVSYDLGKVSSSASKQSAVKDIFSEITLKESDFNGIDSAKIVDLQRAINNVKEQLFTDAGMTRDQLKKIISDLHEGNSIPSTFKDQLKKIIS